VYAAARAADAAEAADSGPGARRDIEPLAAVDHAAMTYLPIEKNLYTEHPDVAALTPEAVATLRRSLDVRVFGADVPRPAIQFAQWGLDEPLLRVIAALGYTAPTAIQAQAVPVALAGRDVVGVAKTGSGKTAGTNTPLHTRTHTIHTQRDMQTESGRGRESGEREAGILQAHRRLLVMTHRASNPLTLAASVYLSVCVCLSL
jgi:hypothetical protein